VTSALIALGTAGLRFKVMKAGLCDTCRHQRIVRNTRGGAFSMCERAKFDERFPKYPRLPVERCPGWERRDPATR
jgi:hypothetical protein